jgi:hypothetical protein
VLEPFRVSTFSDARAFSGVSTFMVPEPFLVSAIFLCLMLFFVEMRTESRLRGSMWTGELWANDEGGVEAPRSVGPTIV